MSPLTRSYETDHPGTGHRRVTQQRRRSSLPAGESGGPHVSLQLLLVPPAGLHVEVLEDVVLALGADLRGGQLQWVAVQQEALQVAQVAVAHRHVGDAVARQVQAHQRQLGDLWKKKARQWERSDVKKEREVDGWRVVSRLEPSRFIM